MNNVGGGLGEMFASSMVVLRQPSVATFERFEKRGNLQKALIYVGVAAVIAGVLGAISTGIAVSAVSRALGAVATGGAVGGFVKGLLGTLLGFLVFAYATFFIGRQQGGTGSFDEVAYSFSLFYAPLQIVGGILALIIAVFLFIPVLNVIVALLGALVGLAIVVAEVYFAYVAVQSSMNLRGQPALITLVVAGLITLVVNYIIGRI